MECDDSRDGLSGALDFYFAEILSEKQRWRKIDRDERSEQFRDHRSAVGKLLPINWL